MSRPLKPPSRALLQTGRAIRFERLDDLAILLGVTRPCTDVREAQGRQQLADGAGVARSNVAERSKGRAPGRIGRPPEPDGELVAGIEEVIGTLPTYGYRRVHAVLRRKARTAGTPAPNHKRAYRVMKLHGLLLDRHAGGHEERRHDGRVAVDRSNLRWCSDGFEIGCDNGEKVRVAFALDCCDREAIAHVATTEGIKGEDISDLIVTAVESRFGRVNRVPDTIEWLSDTGSGYIAHETRMMARDIGLEPRTTPVQSPQSNGMAEAFVRTMKRDYVRVSSLPDRQNRDGTPAFVDRTLKQPSSAQGARLSFTPRVHRGTNPTLIVSDHSGATTPVHGVP